MAQASDFSKMGGAPARFFDSVPHIRALGITLKAAPPGHVVLELGYQRRLVGDPATGVIAGGAVTSLLDTAGGAAVVGALGAFQPIATLDLRIDYLSPATPGRSILGRAECYHITRWIAFTRGVAYHDSADRPIANFTATFMALGDRPFTRESGTGSPKGPR